jgi:hypothetical protein
MPVPFANELSGTAGESKNDLLEASVFALPDLKTVLEQTLNFLGGGPWVRKLPASFKATTSVTSKERATLSSKRGRS